MSEEELKKDLGKIEHEGDAKKVFLDIEKFREDRVKGIEPERGPLFIVLQGAIRGAYGGGGVSALEDLGLRFGFKTAVGVSTGSPTVAYFLSGQSHVGSTIYYEECVTPEFMNIRRGAEGGNVLDISWLVEKAFSEGKKKLDLLEFFRNPTNVYMAVTDYFSGEGYLLNAKDKNQNPVTEILHASCAVPELYMNEVKVNVNGELKRVIDGAVGFPLPVKKSIEMFSPSSILIFANRSKASKDTFLDRLAAKYFAIINNPDKKRDGIEKDIMSNKEIFEENLYELKYSGIPYLIIWTDKKVGNMEHDPVKIKKAVQDFYDYVFNLGKKYLK